MEQYDLKKPYLLFVGTLQPRKNIVRLIEAFSKNTFSSHRLPEDLAVKTEGFGALFGKIFHEMHCSYSRATGNRFNSLATAISSPLNVSFVYEKAGYPTTKSQRFDVGDASITDLSVQLPTEAFFTLAKGQLEQQIGALIGGPYPLRNVLVTTVGKSWASMFSPDLPHGDPGAVVETSPPVQFPAPVGPVYFNESVAPDPTIGTTSVDGGVLFGNLANGSHAFTARKAPFSYATVTFEVEDGFALYVASPPHGIQGTNDSPPGQP